MGAGGIYLFLAAFALATPRLFRVMYWLFMFPLMTLGFSIISWIFGGFLLGWTTDAFEIWAALGTVFGLSFCKWTDPA